MKPQIFCFLICAVTWLGVVNASRSAGGPLEQVPSEYRTFLTTFLESNGKTQTCGTLDPSATCDSMPDTVFNEAVDLCLPNPMNNRMKEIVNKRDNRCPPLYTDIPVTEQCYFYGPRRCEAVSDCWNAQLAGKPQPDNFRYICRDLSSQNGITGKRCFRVCSSEADCPSVSEASKVSGKVKNYVGRFYGCHENICQLKKQYSHIIRFAKNLLGVNPTLTQK